MAAFDSEAEEPRSSRSPSVDIGELNLEQLMDLRIETVYGASKFEQKLGQAPASVTIVTSDEIQKYGHRTLADVLRSVRGLYVSNDRNYTYLGVRGFLRPGDYNTRVLVLIDGHRMNDNVYDASYFGRENMIDVDLIERVEFIRGPSSSIYGGSAFFGVVNVVTKSARQLQGAEVSGEGGSFGSYKGRFSYGRKFKNDLEWLMSGSFYSSEGPRNLYYPEFDQRISLDPRAANEGVAHRSDGEEAANWFTGLRYRDLSLSAFLSSRTKEVPTASFQTLFNHGREETEDYRAFVDLKYDHRFNEDIRLLGRAFYDGYEYYGAYPYDYAAPGDPPFPALYRDESLGDWVGSEWQLTGKLFDRHTVVVGAEYRENLRQHQAAYDDVIPRIYSLIDDRTSRNLGLYAQGEVVIQTNLLLNLGIRHDQYFGSFGGTINPRLGLIYSPWETGSFKALYGEAFRAPNAYERFYFSAQPTLPELRPEDIRTYELAYEQYLARHHRLSVSLYSYIAENLISQTTSADGRLAFKNVDEVKANGVEFELESKYDSGLMGRASYAWQRAEDDLTGMELSNSPRHLATINLSVPVYQDKLFTGLELQYRGRVRTLAGKTEDDFLVANLTLFGQRLVKGLELSASIYNLFDTQYAIPGAEDHLQEVIRQDGRTFRLKLTYRY